MQDSGDTVSNTFEDSNIVEKIIDVRRGGLMTA